MRHWKNQCIRMTAPLFPHAALMIFFCDGVRSAVSLMAIIREDPIQCTAWHHPGGALPLISALGLSIMSDWP